MDLVILVPQGAEYRAVKSAVQKNNHSPQVMAVPIGIGPLMNWIDRIQWQSGSQILVMGLCGSLSPELGAGDGVIYQECVDRSGKIWQCDRTLTEQLQTQLNFPLVRALTSDRIVDSAAEKQQLGIAHQAAVVDMEGIAVLSQLELPIAMIRVVSDDFNQDLPDLSAAIDADGKLQTVPLMLGMIRRPVAAVNLIRGSLVGLNRLATIARQLA
jgi:nucleoside phosphorylase